MNRQKEAAWQEAKRRCRLNDDEVRMAKELGFQPKSLIKNIPSPSQSWKEPVKDWVRSLYEKKIESRKPAARPSAPPSVPIESVPPGAERRNAEDPWPDNPVIPDLPLRDFGHQFLDDEFDYFEPPVEVDAEEQDGLTLRRQRLFRWAAQGIAVAMSELPEVELIAAFGAASQPLEREVPRFHEFRRRGIKILHECADLDLAVWISDLRNLRNLKNAMALGLALNRETDWDGVAHYRVDVHLFHFSTGRYEGRLCKFGQCPKPRKRECHVPGCGAQPYLQQLQEYGFKPEVFRAAPKVILFDRAAGFSVSLPKIDAGPREIEWTPREPDLRTDFTDDDVPF
jgi:hypothetical protein